MAVIKPTIILVKGLLEFLSHVNMKHLALLLQLGLDKDKLVSLNVEFDVSPLDNNNSLERLIIS